MAVETDDHGRLYLPKALREKHGERFRVLDLPRRVVLIPIDDDPLQAVRDALGERFEDRSHRGVVRDIASTVKHDIDVEVEDHEAATNDE
ncbi:MAG: AbrB/MazE/SpoVT family DNA-binding domain-containing protein [Halobacteriales archaeon]|nr:AbrB/MazE/SpoVT family DNA-binding domain-containing protein [Halobacteriales archaeon]